MFAENEYLQLAIETGLVGIFIILVFVFILFKSFFYLLENSRGTLFLISLALMSVVMSCMLHNLVDYNLHIPANALLFFVYCALVFRLEKTVRETRKQY